MAEDIEKENVTQRIKEIFSEIFKKATSEITEDLDVFSLEGWDSLAHVNLLIAIEKEFGIKVENEAVVQLISFLQIDKYVKNNIN